MKKRTTARYFSYTAVLYFIGNAYILGSDSVAGRNSWLSLGIAAILYIPLLCLYGSLASKYRGQSFFEICGRLLGRKIASVAAVIYIFYGIAVFSMSLSCLARFVSADILPETPKVLMASTTALCAVLLVVSGTESMGKWAAFILPWIFAVMLAAVLISIPSLKFENILPVAKPWRNTLIGAYRYSAFPFGEPVAVLALLRGTEDGIKIRHILIPWLTASAVLVLIYLRNTMVLGGALSGLIGFAAFIADSVAGYNGLQQRIEALTSMIPAISSVMEAAVMLLFMIEALRYLVKIKRTAVPAAILSVISVAACMMFYRNNIMLEERAMIWPAISVPLQVFIPFSAWIICIIRNCFLHKNSKIPLKRDSS